ncbi:helix-turn-helix domain-containing protein [Aliarcobacter skirrowii]|uniref:helix-turn-helix domain-containing protein n=1 Tax=Aliarcobacter skirrowii TaxID=28200 RepID=UPI003209E1D7
MLELATPLEIIEKTVILVETQRKIQNLQQKELSKKADIPFPTYKQFLYQKKISFENLIKLFIALNMFENLKGLLKEKEFKTLDEIKNQDKLPKRIDKRARNR